MNKWALIVGVIFLCGCVSQQSQQQSSGVPEGELGVGINTDLPDLSSEAGVNVSAEVPSVSQESLGDAI
jgi:hypothetical protein